jgi:intracellular multiplication protein IcmL
MASGHSTIDKRNMFYRDYYPHIIFLLVVAILVMLGIGLLVMYQVFHRPQPHFYAATPDGHRMILLAHDEPILVPHTLIEWASKAAVAAYTFDFYNYPKQIEDARYYFTDSGWADYQNSVAGLLGTIAQNKLFVNGVVSEPPVISNQGPLPGKGYVWRVQVPFLVTYQSAETTSQQRFTIMINIVRVPTNVNPEGIGVDQFIMS